MPAPLVKWLYPVFRKLFQPEDLRDFLRTQESGKSLVAALPSTQLLSREAYWMEAAEQVVKRGLLSVEFLTALQERGPSLPELDDLMLAIMAAQTQADRPAVDPSNATEPADSPADDPAGGADQVYERSAYLQGERLEQWMRLLDQELFAVGTSFYQSVPNVRDILIDKALSGTRIRYLFFDPASPHLELVARGFGQSPADLKAELEKTRAILVEIRRALPAAERPNFQVRLYAAPPAFRMYAFDPAHPDSGRSIVIPYRYGIDSPLLPAFERRRPADDYLARAEKLWGEANELVDEA